MYIGRFNGPGTPIAKRLKVFQPGFLRYGRTALRIHLLDLSATGALAHGDDPPAPGTMVMVDCGSLRTAARVVWMKGPRFGLAFAAPLSNDDMSRFFEYRPR